MSLQKSYQRFLATPNSFALTENASIHYITSGRSINSRESILNHLSRESKQLKKRMEKVISTIETIDDLALEIETEIEIITTAGNFLPGLDENFLADQVIVFPIIHLVKFQDGLISQVRLFWDQSTCLKQLGVIGRTGRNWPIIEGREQCKLIQKSVSAVLPSSTLPLPELKASNGNGNANISPKRPGSNGSTTSTASHISRDPHASFSLFGGSDHGEEFGRPIAPRACSTYHPPSRDLTAIVGTPDNVDQERSKHPLPKARSSFSRQQTYHVGENGDEQDTTKPVEKTPKVNPKKYTHFEFGNGEDASHASVVAKPRPLHAKNGPSWDFEDFVTPERKPLRSRPDDVRHFGWSDDDEGAAPSPVRQPRKIAPRKDTETHFSMKDVPDTPVAPLSNITNKQPARRDVVSQFEIADNSPSDAAQQKKEYHATTKAVAKNMKSNWEPSDDDPDAFFGRMGGEAKPAGIHIAGNGQGKRKETDNHWAHGDNSPRTNIPGKTAGGSVVSRKQTETSGGGFWDY